MIAYRRKEAEDALRERAARAEEHFGLSGGAIVVRDGDPAVELLRVAEEVNADEIVVGASTQRIGSVAAYLVRRAGVPVTVVPVNAVPHATARRVQELEDAWKRSSEGGTGSRLLRHARQLRGDAYRQARVGSAPRVGSDERRAPERAHPTGLQGRTRSSVTVGTRR